MYSRPLSRPVRITESDLTSGKVLVRSAQTVVTAISVTAQGNDIIAKFRNGSTGEVLWEMEGDNSAGSSNISFAPKGLLFTQGLYVEVEDPVNMLSVCVALDEPQSSGS